MGSVQQTVGGQSGPKMLGPFFLSNPVLPGGINVKDFNILHRGAFFSCAQAKLKNILEERFCVISDIC